jgi:hypothetical protein
MVVTDNRVQGWLMEIDFPRLFEQMDDVQVDEYPSEIQAFADELSYAIGIFNDDSTVWYATLRSAKNLLRDTNNGTTIPLDADTFKPKVGYTPKDFSNAQDIIDTYNRMVDVYRQLKKLGYHGQWWD